METFVLTERLTDKEIAITAFSWEIKDYQHNFYADNGFGQVITRSYPTRFYNLTDRYNESTSEKP